MSTGKTGKAFFLSRNLNMAIWNFFLMKLLRFNGSKLVN